VGYSYAELGSRKPDSGGSYAIVATSLGAPTALLTAAFQLLAYVASAAFYAWALGEYLSVIGIPLTRLTAVALLLLVTLIVALGAREAGLFTVMLATLKVTILGGVGLLALASLHPPPPKFSLDLNLLRCAALVFLGFEGFEVAVSAGGEMRNPRRDVKLAIFTSLAVVTVIYSLLAAARAAAIPEGYATRALAFIAMKVAEEMGLIAVLLGSMVSSLSAATASIYASSRLLYALARDGYAPQFFTSTWRRAPGPATVTVSALSIIAAVLGNIELLLKASSAAFILLFLLVSLSGVKALEKKWLPALSTICLMGLAALLLT